MNSRERVFAALRHEAPDSLPHFEVWIDSPYYELGLSDPNRAFTELGEDGVLLPSGGAAESKAWKDGVDEWGRGWKRGMYSHGVVDAIRTGYPDHSHFFVTHIYSRELAE